MELELLTPEAWLSEQKRLIGFAIRYGDKRLAVSTIHVLRKLDPSLLKEGHNAPNAAVAVIAKQSGRIVGFGFAQDGGEGACMFVVHPEARSLGIGGKILQAMIERLGKLSCNVAVDNTASMALCFRLGMTAVSMHRGPTGKPTLRFEKDNKQGKARPSHPDCVPQ